MEFFNKAKTVRLRSHLDKYLIADDDGETVKQSRNGSSRKARWEVELVTGKSHVVRLRSCHGRYLAAADEPFLLGMTGKKVRQVVPATKADVSVEWEPIKDGIFVKMRSKSSSKFLRANWGTPPWRNSVTHDAPHRTATQDWVLWEVEVVDISLSESESPSSFASPASSFSSLSEEVTGSETRSPSIWRDRLGLSRFSSSPDDFSGSQGHSLSTVPNRSGLACAKQSGMMLFDKAKAVRLQSHLGKYLVADDDEQTVRQSRNGSSHNARWTIELVDGKSHVLRLKSHHGRYLNATDEPFLLGMTGKKVLQTEQATKTDTSTEWEPIKEGLSVKLRSHDGKFLRANGGTPPWRNSVTHDIPHRMATQDWVLWGVDVVDISFSDSDSDSDSLVSRNVSLVSSFCSSVDDFAGSPDTGSPVVVNGGSSHKAFRGQSSSSSVKSEGRIIYYSVADDDEKFEEGRDHPSFHFKGQGLEELTEKLEEETGLVDIILCSRNPFNGKLYPLRLALPPNNANMHVVVVPSSSEVARDFTPEIPTSA